MWNLLFTFDHSSAESGGIIRSGTYLPTFETTADTFLELATESGTYSPAAEIREARTLAGSLSSPYMTPLIALKKSCYKC